MFTGRETDILDNGSLKIQYNRNRSYDYSTGRWLQRDPLGYVDGMNLYEYIKGNSLIATDPFGFQFPPSWPPWLQWLCKFCEDYGSPSPDIPVFPPFPEPLYYDWIKQWEKRVDLGAGCEVDPGLEGQPCNRVGESIHINICKNYRTKKPPKDKIWRGKLFEKYWQIEVTTIADMYDTWFDCKKRYPECELFWEKDEEFTAVVQVWLDITLYMWGPIYTYGHGMTACNICNDLKFFFK